MEFQKFNKIPRLSRDCTISEKTNGTNGQLLIISNKNFKLSAINQEEFFSLKDQQDFINKYCLYESPEDLYINEEDRLYLFAGSRKRWLNCSSKGDNYGFAKWVKKNAVDLMLGLGEGRFYGEWMGQDIQVGYGLKEKRFLLFNTKVWCNYDQEPKLISINRKTGEEKYQKKCPKCCAVVPVLYEGLFDTQKIQEVLDDLEKNGSKVVPGFMQPEGIVIFHQASGQMYKKTIIEDEKPKGK